MLTLEVYEPDATTLVGDIPPGQFASVDFGDVGSDTGQGSIRLPLVIAEGATNPAVAMLTTDRVVRFLVDDVPVWQMLVEDYDEEPISPDNEAGEYRVVEGRGVMAIFDTVKWLPDAGLDNQPFYPTRWLHFAARRLRDDDPAGPSGVWADAVNQDPEYATSNYFGRSQGYIDTSGMWVAGRDSRTLFAPGGIWYFRGTITLDAEYDLLLQGAWDDEGELWIDDVPALRAVGVYKGQCVEARITLSAGEHQIAGWCRNLNELRTGVIFAGWSVDDGMADELLFRADESWLKVLEFPDRPPGFTATEVIRLFVDEANDRGMLPDVDDLCNFISASDSEHKPLQEVTDIAVKAPADSGLTTLLMLGETYLDLWMSPTGLELNALIRGTRGNAA